MCRAAYGVHPYGTHGYRVRGCSSIRMGCRVSGITACTHRACMHRAVGMHWSIRYGMHR